MIMHDNIKLNNEIKSCNVIWKLHGNITQNDYRNVMIDRHGGCFEKYIGLMCRGTRESPHTDFGSTGEKWTNSQMKKGKAQQRRGQKIWMVDVPKTEG